MSSSGTNDSSGAPPTKQEVEALCSLQSTQKACEGVEQGGSGTDLAWCAWEHWVEVTIDESGACVFGAVEERCGYQNGGDACGGPLLACLEGATGSWDGARIRTGSRWCYPPFYVCTPDDPESPPECACFCDPGYPD